MAGKDNGHLSVIEKSGDYAIVHNKQKGYSKYYVTDLLEEDSDGVVNLSIQGEFNTKKEASSYFKSLFPTKEKKSK